MNSILNLNSILNSLHTLLNEATDSPYTDTQKNILRQMKGDLYAIFQDHMIKRKMTLILASKNKEDKQNKLRALISYIQSKSSSSSSISVSNQSQIIEQMEHSPSSLNISLQQEKEKRTIIRHNLETDINNRIKEIEENLDNNNKNIVKEHLSKLIDKINILFKENLEMNNLLQLIIDEKNTRYNFLMDNIYKLQEELQKKEEREKEFMNEMNSQYVKRVEYQNAINNDLQNQLNEKGRIINDLQNQLNEKDRIIEEKNKEQNSLKEAIMQLKSQLTKFPWICKQLKGKETKNQELRQTINRMNEKIKILQEDIQKLENTIKSNQKAYEKDISNLKKNYTRYEEYKEQYDFCLIRKFLSFCIDKCEKKMTNSSSEVKKTLGEYIMKMYNIRKIACKKIHFEPYLPFYFPSKDGTFTFFCHLINNTNIRDINNNRLYLPNDFDTFLSNLFGKKETDFMDEIEI